MRLAGTIDMHSNSAMPQLMSAAINHGLSERFFRCAYQAKVMKQFDAIGMTVVVSMVEPNKLLMSMRRDGEANSW